MNVIKKSVEFYFALMKAPLINLFLHYYGNAQLH